MTLIQKSINAFLILDCIFLIITVFLAYVNAITRGHHWKTLIWWIGASAVMIAVTVLLIINS